MRDIDVILRRINVDLSVTDDELTLARKWIDKEKRRQRIQDNVIYSIILILLFIFLYSISGE